VHVSRDGGYSWKKISDKLPQELWVSRVWASAHALGRVYVSLNGYRYDNFESYVYVSEDFGENWQRLGMDLPAEPVNVIKEDPKNEQILYVGTDHGLYISLDRGKNFMYADNGIPAVAVHDLTVQEREGHLIVATHGRSLYRADVKKLQSMSREIMSKELFVFDLEEEKANPNLGKPSWNKWFPVSKPAAKWAVWVKNGGTLGISIKSEKGTLLKKLDLNVKPGYNLIEYDFTIEESVASDYQKELNEKRTADNQKPVTVEASDDGKFYLKAGKFTVDFSVGGKSQSKEWILTAPKKRNR
jgi:hypothetical protein